MLKKQQIYNSINHILMKNTNEKVPQKMEKKENDRPKFFKEANKQLLKDEASGLRF